MKDTSHPARQSGDQLGVVRTALANERTLLAYVRTALAFLITGASLLKFFESRPYEVAGIVALAVGAGAFAAGFFRYARVRRQISRIDEVRSRDGVEEDVE